MIGGGDRIEWRALWLTLVVTAAYTAGCSQAVPPVVDGPGARVPRVPVVFVPGVTGVGLLEEATGEPVWGTGKTLITPHDRGYGAARAVVTGQGKAEVVPGKVILDLKLLGLLRFAVYQPLVDHFEANGYRLGDLADPAPDEDFFLFAYDWRGDNVASAALLTRQLENLRQLRGQNRLQVNLVCQSNGAHVCRYFAKYGGLSLEEAEAGQEQPDDRLDVGKLVLVGASNGGSIRVLRELNRGRKYVAMIGRTWSPETLFTFESLYQDLPVYTDDLFVDQQGEPMAVDLFDGHSWEMFAWSIFAPEIQKRLSTRHSPSWFGSAVDRRAYLIRALERAQRFHRLLRLDAAGFGSPHYYLIMNTHNETSSRAVLLQKKGHWQTLFADDRLVRQTASLRAAVVVEGDGHATAASQRWLSPQERKSVARDPFDSVGSHRRIILQPETHAHLLEILADGGDPDR